MSNESNLMIKKLLQKVSSQLLKRSEYDIFSDVEVFFAFGSKHKTAMCDYVYGIKIKSEKQFRDNYIISKLQSDIKTNMNRLVDIDVCCTDVIFEKN